MSDYNSGLPIRSEADGTDQRVHVKIVDGTNPAVFQTQVDADKNLHVESHGNNPAGADVVQALSEAGETRINGLYNVATNTLPAKIGIMAANRAASPIDSDQTQRLTAVTSGTVHALDVSMHDESGDAFSITNPFPVTVVDSEGTEVNDYNTAAALAALATSNHDYTVTAAKTLKLSHIWATGSGKLKIEVQIETGAATGVFNTKFVGFNSTATPNIDIPIGENIAVAAGVRVRVIRTNRDLQAQDVYSTISGHETP